MSLQPLSLVLTPILLAISVSPADLNLTGDYRLKFKGWINYNGPLFDGGSGSNQLLS